MKKNVFGRRLKRDKNQRQALFKSLVSSLVLKGRIETTEQKAKAIKADVDKLITRVKKGGNNSQFLGSYLFPNAFDKLVLEVVPSFKNRQSGYTRLIRKGRRLSDNATIVVMEWVEREAVTLPAKVAKKKVVKKTVKPAPKKAVRKTTPSLALKTKASRKETKNVKKTK